MQASTSLSLRLAMLGTLATLVWGTGQSVADANASLFQLWQTRAGDASRDGHAGGGVITRFPFVAARIRIANLEMDESAAAMMANLDGQGPSEEVGIDEGSVVALNSDLSTRWTSQPLGVQRIEGFVDLDGDGIGEVLATSNTSLFVIDASDGSVAFEIGYDNASWSTQARPDNQGQLLLIKDRGATSGLRAYTFTDAPGDGQLAWQIINGLPEGDFDYTLGELNGDDQDWEVFIDDRQGARRLVFSAATGDSAQAAQNRTVSGLGGCGPAWAMNLDNDPQQEVLFTATRRPGPQDSVFAAVYDHGQDMLQWKIEFGVGNLGAQGMDISASPPVDLDADGGIELVLSTFSNDLEVDDDGQAFQQDGLSAPGIWNTTAYDAATGELIASMPDRRIVGIIPQAQGPAVVLTRRARIGLAEISNDEQNLQGAILEDGQWRTLWSLNKTTAVTLPLPSTTCAGDGVMPPLLLPSPQDQPASFFVQRYFDDDLKPDLIQRISLVAGEARVTATLELEPHQNFQPLNIAPAQEGALMSVLMDDGYLHVVNQDLEDQQLFPLARGLVDVRGLKNVDQEGASYWLKLHDAQGPVRVLDPVTLGEDNQATQIWEAPEGTWVPDTILTEPDDSKSIFPTARIIGGDVVVEMLSNDGSLFWSRTLTGTSDFPALASYAHVGGSEHEDLLLLYQTPSGPTLDAFDGESGETLHSLSLSDIPGASLQSRLLRIPGERPGDLDEENETDDLIMIHTNGATLIDGEAFSVLRALDTGSSAFLSSLMDLDGDDDLELVVQNPNGGRSAIDLATNEELWSLEIQPSYASGVNTYLGLPRYVNNEDMTMGAHVAIGGDFGDLTLYHGVTGEAIWSVCLSGGEVTPIALGVTLDAQSCDGVPMADLNTARPDLGNSDQILASAADGWVYIVRIEEAATTWIMSTGQTPGPVIVADADGDNNPNLVIPVDNGNIYAMEGRFSPVESPREVELNDEGMPTALDTDLDSQDHSRGLAFAWERVIGARGYRVIVEGDDGHLSDEITTGALSNFALLAEDYPLSIGTTYRAWIRAESSTFKLSPWRVSTGVTLLDTNPPSLSAGLLSPALLSHTQGQSVQIQAEATDMEGLRQIILDVLPSGSDDVIWTTSQALERATTWTGMLTWDGRDQDGRLVEDGDYTLRVRVEDFGDLTATQDLTSTLDGTGPNSPVWSFPQDNALLTELRPRLEGNTEPNATVSVTLNDEALCETSAAGDSFFACAPEADLVDGDYEAIATATDALGNTGEPSAPLRFTLDTTPPEAPVILSPINDETLLPGPVTFSLRAEPNTSLTVFRGPAVLCEVNEADEADGDLYTCETSDLTEGDYTVFAQATDNAGFDSEPSMEVSFRLETPEEPDMGTDADEPDVMEPEPDMPEEDLAEPDMVEPEEDLGTPDLGTPDMGVDMPQPEEDTGTIPNVGSPSDDCGCATPAQPARKPWLTLLPLLVIGALLVRKRR